MEEVIVNGKKYQLGHMYRANDGEIVILDSIGAGGAFECQSLKLLDTQMKYYRVNEAPCSLNGQLHELKHFRPNGFQAGTITPVIKPKEGERWLCEVTIEKNQTATIIAEKVLRKHGTNWYPVHLNTKIKPIYKMVKAED